MAITYNVLCEGENTEGRYDKEGSFHYLTCLCSYSATTVPLGRRSKNENRS